MSILKSYLDEPRFTKDQARIIKCISKADDFESARSILSKLSNPIEGTPELDKYLSDERNKLLQKAIDSLKPSPMVPQKET